MALAIRLARRGLGQVWPNPAVGAVLVREGAHPEIIATGSTAPSGRPHAETLALVKAGLDAAGTTLYVTLEPCSHHGKTPPCADAIIAANVARVVCAVDDPDARVNGQGYVQLRQAGIALETGVMLDEARWDLLGHILRVTLDRPFVQLKLAVGADGLMAPGQGAPVWVTSEAARARAHLIRARADAILVGRGTVEADDPELTCRLPGLANRSPVRVVLDSALRLSTSARLMNDADRVPVWVLTTEKASADKAAALEQAGARIIRISADTADRVNLQAALAALAADGITRLLVEGGPTVAAALLDGALVDEAVLFQGATPAGEGGLQPFGNSGLDRLTRSGPFKLHLERPIGPDDMRVYRRGN